MRAAEGRLAGQARGGVVGLAVAIALASACAAGGNGDEGAGGGGGTASSGAAGNTGGGAGTTAPIAGTIGTAGTSGAAGTACTGAPVAHMSWTLGRDGTSPAITCDQASATSVQLFMNAQRSEFSCAAGTGTTAALTPGMYTPRVVVTGAQGAQVLSQGNLPAVTIPSCGNTSLGNVRFVVTASTSGAAGSGGGAGSTGAAGSAGSTGAAGTGGGTGPCNALPIFATHNCTVMMACHDASGSAAAFNMASAGWEKLLVGRLPKTGGAAGLGSQCIPSGTPYLKAGSNPASGLFLQKLNKPTCGQQMPLLPPDLTPQELDCVQRWANGLVGIKGF